MILAFTAISSGFLDNCRAAAGGTISKEVINNTPTIFIETAITNAISNNKIKFIFAIFIPSISANSWCTVIDKKSFQNL